MIINFCMEAPEGPSNVNPAELLYETVNKPLGELVAKYELGVFEEIDPEVLANGTTICAFHIRSFYSYLNSVTCYFERDGTARFVRLPPTGHANILEGSWIFAVYMTVPFIQELMTTKKNMKKQADILKRVAKVLEGGQREIL